jgi:predicted RNA-binding Zn ribbon-like protein
MNFSHYSDQPAQLAVDLVNTDEAKGDEIGTLAELEVFLARYAALRPADAGAASESDLRDLHALRDKLRQIFDAPDEATAVGHLNDILAENQSVARLSVHDGDPHLHFEPVGSSISSWVAAMTAMGLAGVVVEHGIRRFGSCQASNCRDVFIDTTRNRSRTHCCTTCSTRDAVAAYRKRQAVHP